MDVNGDRRADLVFNSTQQSTGNDANLVTVFLAQADGTFQRQPQQTLGQASGWKDYFKNWLDVNGDGRTDLLWIINPTTNTNSVYVALAQSDGTFTLLPRQDFGAGWSGFGWSVGDLNGDGYGDFARFARQQEANNTYTALTATFLGSAAGTFTRVKDFQQFTVDAAFPTSGYLVDVNGDGRDDLLWNKKTTSNINLAVFLAGDDGLFTRLNSQTFAILPTPASTRVWFEDVNGDDRADLLILGSLGNSLKTAIYTANASGVFAPLKEASYLFGFNASFSQVMALNGDHKIDMLAFSSTTQSPPLPFKGENLIYPLFGTGNGNFTPQPMQYIPMQMWSILPFLTQGDVSGDGILDLIWYSSSNNHFMVTVGVLQTGHQLHLPLTQRRR